jgi:hypothetical protein
MKIEKWVKEAFVVIGKEGSSMPRPYTYAGEHTTQNERINL